MDDATLKRLAEARPRLSRIGIRREQAAQFLDDTFSLLISGGHPEDCQSRFRSDAIRLEADLLQLLTGIGRQDEEALCQNFFEGLVQISRCLAEDAEIIRAGDPAANNLDEVILAYPGFYAIAAHRVAHMLWQMKVPTLPRLVSEYAHERTGVDIHPGARIGCPFFLDHGTGVVIGQTTEIGDRVKIYQGVTLGALSVDTAKASGKRHPTIGDDVVLYANATVLGGDTHIGDGAVIGGNVWLTESVPPRSVVYHRSTVRIRHSEEPDDGLEFHI
ncbi:MAG: serine O-acetyltransferase EpsC [Myxococcota bacterium]